LNKRQKKKRNKIVYDRVKFFSNHIFWGSRQNGKKYLNKKINEACSSKKYMLFKKLKKIYDKVFFSIELSNSIDYGVKTTVKIEHGIIRMINTEILN
jgi:hypothetical protein